MPRPKPLANLSSARPSSADYPSLTPRTPHSRLGRQEESFDAVTQGDEYQTIRQQQIVPLLLSSASDSFPGDVSRAHENYHGTLKRRSPSQGWFTEFNFYLFISRLPLFAGALVASFLLFLIFLSYERPDQLHAYFGGIPPNRTQTSPSQTSSPVSTHANNSLLSYEGYTRFPLLPTEYLAECNKLHHGFMSHGDYWQPNAIGVLDVAHHDDNHDYKLPEGEKTAVCSKTITYMLSGEVGLLADLALMAQAAALARERNRTFLVDDTYWDRGRWVEHFLSSRMGFPKHLCPTRWTDHFQDVRARQPGPEPGCRAPPPEELVACPRLARHWVIVSTTAKFHFGHGFSNHYEDSYAHQLNRLKPIFESAADSFSSTIRPNAVNAALIRTARTELSQLLASDDAHLSFAHYVAVHIRRGDRKPASYRYHGDYVPIAEYVKAVSQTWDKFRMDDEPKPFVYVASDSPSAHAEFIKSLVGARGALTYSLRESRSKELRGLSSKAQYVQAEFDQLSLDERIRDTRGMIIDFALLSGLWSWGEEIKPETIVCTLSSNVCKMAAVGLGWHKAFGDVDQMGYLDENGKGWIEIDQGGQIVPVWEPFELF